MSEQFDITWIDRRREPSEPPNLAYPRGVDLDVSLHRKPACVAPLPYPAARCGIYTVRCIECGFSVALTTAGRPDDPRSVRLPCRKR